MLFFLLYMTMGSIYGAPLSLGVSIIYFFSRNSLGLLWVSQRSYIHPSVWLQNTKCLHVLQILGRVWRDLTMLLLSDDHIYCVIELFKRILSQPLSMLVCVSCWYISVISMHSKLLFYSEELISAFFVVDFEI